MTNLDNILESRDITLPTKVCMYVTIKKTEHQRIDAFELWCWKRLLRVSWTVRGSNQSILKGVKPPVKFGERTWDCSPGHAGKDGPHLAMTEGSCGFSRVAAPVWGFTRGTTGSQGASRVAPGKSGLHVRGEGERIIALELW